MPTESTGNVGRAVAALPMYDWPDVRETTDTLWHHLALALKARGLDVPDRLDRERSSDNVWRDPDLLIAQTCGYPFVTEYRDHVRLVATPVYNVEGCSGPLYCSQIVVRSDENAQTLAELQGRRVAINNMASQSGFAALRAAVTALGQPGPFFGAAELSGSHLNSMRSVADGGADVAAIDTVAWALALRYRPDIANHLKSIATTAMTPGLPFVTARSRPDEDVRLIAEALDECLANPGTAGARAQLFLKSVDRVAEADYLTAYSRLDETDIATLIPGGRAADHQADKSKAVRNPSR